MTIPIRIIRMNFMVLRCHVKIPSRERKRRAKQREEYLQNQDDELESSRIRYDADAEQRRASARHVPCTEQIWSFYCKRWRQEKNSVAVQVSIIRGGVMN